VGKSKRIHSGDLKRHLEFLLRRVYPFGLHNSVSIMSLHTNGIRTIFFMDFYTFINGYKSKNRISRNRVTATGQFIIQFFFFRTKNEQIVVFTDFVFLNFFRICTWATFDFLEKVKKRTVFLSHKILELLVVNTPYPDSVKKV